MFRFLRPYYYVVMAGYGCKHLSADAVVKIESFLAKTLVVCNRKSIFMVERSFVDLVEQGKVAGKSLEELLHRRSVKTLKTFVTRTQTLGLEYLIRKMKFV